MTNREFYKEDILNIVCDRPSIYSNEFSIAVNKDTHKLCRCEETSYCNNCLFKNDDKDCGQLLHEWFNSEYEEPCPFAKDELVEVSDDGVQWCLRRFSSIEDGRIRCFVNGKTSNRTSMLTTWKYCRKYGTLGGLNKEVEG